MNRKEQKQSSQEKAFGKHRITEVGGGVEVQSVPVTKGERLTVSYNGLLAQSGAQEIYLHAGYGSADQWQMVTDIPLKRNDGAWEATITPDANQRLNFCFHDNAGNWDNNHRLNWSFSIHG